MQRKKDTDFADMPSLSSFRADDLSAVTSTSYTSFASNSRGGDSRGGGDCDISLPSLSSFRMEDLSTCSSYHSVQTATNHLSDHSVEGWGSFTSGNVSAETDSEDGKRRAKVIDNGEMSSAPIKPTRNSSGSDIIERVFQKGRTLPPTRGVLKHDSSLESDTAPTPRITPSSETNTLPMKRPTRTVSPVRPGNDLPPKADPDQSSTLRATTSNARPPPRSSSDTTSPERTPVARTESLQLDGLQQRPQKDRAGGSMTIESLRNSSTLEGSSSSLRGGDSLPRLPRRTSTVDVSGDDNDSVRSNLSDGSTKMSDDEVTRISEGDVSLGSDVASDLSIETDTEHVSLVGDHSDRSTVETPKASASGVADEKRDVVPQQKSDFPTHIVDHVEVSSAEPARTPPEEITTESSHAAAAPSATIESETATIENSPEQRTQQDDPPNKRSAEESPPKKNDSDKSGSTKASAEESGGTTDTDDVDDPKDASNEKRDGENKRGKLLRKMSNSFRNIGKTASFRNSFLKIGKQASKLKKSIAVKRQGDDGQVLSKPSTDEPDSTDR